MTYKLKFLQPALKEWSNLPPLIRDQLKKKLENRLQNPEIPSARLRHMDRCYKIKLRNAGYRLIYQVSNSEIIITVISVGKREKNAAYKAAQNRIP